jgi:putative DNA primase/helicase
MIQLYTPEEIASAGDIRLACAARYKVESTGASMAYADSAATACIHHELAYLRSNWMPIVPEDALQRMPPELRQTARNTNDTSVQLARGCCEGIARNLPYLQNQSDADSVYQEAQQYAVAFGGSATLDAYLLHFAILGNGVSFAASVNSITFATFDTEQSLAHMLARLLQESHRFQVDSDEWYVFRDNRWAPSAQVVVESLVGSILAGFSKVFLDQAQQMSTIKATAQQAGTIIKLATKIASASKVASMLTLLRSSPLLQQRGEFRQIPGILNAPNVTFDLRQSTVLPQSRNLYLTQAIGPVFDLARLQELYQELQANQSPEEWFARHAPHWTRFCDEIFCGDKALIRYVRRILGVALSGFNVDECFYLLHGRGANGKSTFLSVLRHVFHEYSVSIPFQSIIKPPQYQSDPRRPDLLRMRDKRLTMVTELPAGYELDMAMMKTLTGRDPVDVRDNYAKSAAIKSFEPIALIFIACNNLPEVTEADRGTWRRIRKIPFLASFEGRADPFLRQKLISEAPVILLDLLYGYYDYQDEPQLAPPECVTSAVQQMQEDKDLLVDWLSECCEVTGDPSDIELVADLNASYNAWCHERMQKPLSGPKFANGLTDRQIQTAPRDKVGTKRGRVRCGIRLLSTTERREENY